MSLSECDSNSFNFIRFQSISFDFSHNFIQIHSTLFNFIRIHSIILKFLFNFIQIYSNSLQIGSSRVKQMTGHLNDWTHSDLYECICVCVCVRVRVCVCVRGQACSCGWRLGTCSGPGNSPKRAPSFPQTNPLADLPKVIN